MLFSCKRASLGIAAVAMISVLAPVSRAQAVAGADVDGHVTDPSGQPIVNAQVKMTETDSNSFTLL